MSDNVSPILTHYESGYEAGRLSSGSGPLERARTQELLSRYLPPPPATVLDVGGGPGVYSRWLLERGYRVELIDLVPVHVEQARNSFTEIGPNLAHARTGDARNLEVDSDSQDVVLLMGPLYHLPDRRDRLRALAEAWRVLRPGGLLIAAVISKYASLLDGMSRLLVRDPAFATMMLNDLRTGVHENVTGNPEYFTTAFFHHPDEIVAELGEAGFTGIERNGIEGPFWCLRSYQELWDDEKLRELMLESLRRIENETTLMGVSAHLLVVGRKLSKGM